MTGDAHGAQRRWPWIVVTTAILSNYTLYAASLIAQHRAGRSSGLATNGVMAFVLPNLRTLLPWTVVIVMAALTAYRGRPALAMMPATTLILVPWMLAPPFATHRMIGPSCCSGFLNDPLTGWLEFTAMLLMVALPVLVLRRDREPIRAAAWIVSALMAAFAAVILIGLAGMTSGQGRVDDHLLVYGAAAGLIGLGVGSGVRPWLLAVIPIASVWGVLPTVSGSDGWLMAIALTTSVASPLARTLDRGWMSHHPADQAGSPAGGRAADHPLVSTTS